MRTMISVALAAIVALTGLAVPAFAATTCLQTRDIKSSQPNKAGTSILFTMRDGKQWRNQLRGRCPTLWFNGFVWVIHGPAEVCGNQQSLRVIHTGEVCTLGDFSPVPPAAPAHKG